MLDADFPTNHLGFKFLVSVKYHMSKDGHGKFSRARPAC